MDVVLFEVFREEEEAIRAILPAGMKAEFCRETIQESGLRDTIASIISVRTQSLIPGHWSEVIEGVLTRSTGFDHLLRWRAGSGEGIPCGYLPEYCANAVAEHVVCALLGLWRRFKKQIRQFERFDRDGLTGEECAGKQVLVVGVGRVGSRIVGLARALGMEVRGVDPVQNVDDLKYVALPDGVEWADAIVSAVPLNETTAGMLDYKLLGGLKRKPLLVNVSRGEVSPVGDTIRLLDEGILSGLSMDVFEEEPVIASALRTGTAQTDYLLALKKLKDRNNVILTPHNAFNTAQALKEKARQSVESLKMFLSKKSFPWPVE